MVRSVRLAIALWVGTVLGAEQARCLAEMWPRVPFNSNCPFALGSSFRKWSKGELPPYTPVGAYLFHFPDELVAWIDHYSKLEFELMPSKRSADADKNAEKYRIFIENTHFTELKKGENVKSLEDMNFGRCPTQIQGLVRHPQYGDVYLVYLGRF